MRLLEHIPCFDPDSACTLAEKHFGIRASAHPLPSERDQNFLLTDNLGRRVVLKIANAEEDPEILEAQNAVLDHLGGRISFCPRVLPSTTGRQTVEVESPAGSTNLIRLVSYLPGIPLAEIRSRSPRLLRDLGEKIGQLNRELVDFDHPAIHRDFHWDLANGLRIINEYESLIQDSALRQVVNRFRGGFETEVGPLLAKLRRSVIHGDANDYNVLVNLDDVVGLIDFGDIVYSYTVGDLAVAIAYVILDKPDPLTVATHVVSGYRRAYPLLEVEVDALWQLVLMRLCMSLCLSAHQQKQRPENEYLKISQQAIRGSLPGLVAIDPRVVTRAFRGVACQ